MQEEKALFIGVKDIAGLVELTLEVRCKHCKERTTLTFTPTENSDECGFCEQPYTYDLNFMRLFGAPEVV